MNKISVLIIDDEPSAREVLIRLIDKFEFINRVYEAEDYEHGIIQYSRYVPDLMFVDIKLPVHNGLDLLDKLQSLGYRPQVIFTTGFNQYAIKAIDYDVHGYLLKPIDREKLLSSLLRFVRRNEDTSGTAITPTKVRIRYRTGFYDIDENNILFLQAENNYTRLVCKNEEIIASENLGLLLERLGNCFLRIHRSYAINFHYFHQLDRKQKKCYLQWESNKIKLPVSAVGLQLLQNEGNLIE